MINMPRWDYKNTKCKLCDSKIKEKDIFPYCMECKKIIIPTDRYYIFGHDMDLFKKAQLLSKGWENDLLTKECFIKKRDRLLYLQKISKDKYLTKLKKEVDKI